MKKYCVALLLCLFSLSSHAENPPLRVAIAAFAPPFVMQSAEEAYYGFDVATVEYLCKELDRKCEYIPMNFDDLFNAVLNEEADIAIGGIIITIKRARMVRFSAPYLVSKGQFLATNKFKTTEPFDLSQLNKKRIGVLNDSAFERTVKFMDGVDKPRLITFERDSQMIDALRANAINVALLSVPKARYWRSNSAGLFKTVGNPFPVGFGFAAAINPKNRDLIKAINIAILQYQDSEAFKQNYNMYFNNKF